MVYLQKSMYILGIGELQMYKYDLICVCKSISIFE